jgi:hypothetical protein
VAIVAGHGLDVVDLEVLASPCSLSPWPLKRCSVRLT